MDEFTASMFVHDERIEAPEPTPEPSQTTEAPENSDPEDGHGHHSDVELHPAPSRGLRGRVAALRDKAAIQDRLLEKLLQQVIPDDGADSAMLDYPTGSPLAQRPNFNITTMSNNFRRFNARIGVVFKFQARAIRLLSWRHYSHTLSFLAVYTFVCLDPYLLSVLPLALLIVGVLIPSFLARHPAAPTGPPEASSPMGYSPRGPPLAPAMTVKPVKELSRDFFRNMRDLQNSMDDFCVAHDKVITSIVPATNFSNEALSSALFLALFAGCLVMSIAAHLLPWRIVFLMSGWTAICTGHPALSRVLESVRKTHVEPQRVRAQSAVDKFIAHDIILDSAPETREVEIFELQRISPAGEWEPWLFSPSPYDPLSHLRIAGERPRGTRFFEDVLAPEGWEWSEKKWALDLWSREWVEERIITGVEVETEGERWVYDIYDESEAQRTGLAEEPSDVSASSTGNGKARTLAVPTPSWEENLDGGGRRGEWRRRRWVRLVKRQSSGGEA